MQAPHRIPKAAFAVIALVVVAVVLAVWHPWSLSDGSAVGGLDVLESGGAESSDSGEEPAAFADYDPSPTDMSGIQLAGHDTITGFTLTGSGDAPVLSDDATAAITASLEQKQLAKADVGFLLMDIQTGRGVAYNIDDEIYGASSFKGPYCTYLCSHNIEDGSLSLSSSVTRVKETESGGYTRSGGSSDTLRSLISDTVKYSSNAAYVSMRLAFDDSELAAWLVDMGADKELAYDTNFPTYTVRDAARLWTTVYNYLDTDSETAAFLRDLYGATEVSFVRDGVTQGGYTLVEATGENGEEVAVEVSDAEGSEAAAGAPEEVATELVVAEAEDGADAEGEVMVKEAVGTGGLCAVCDKIAETTRTTVDEVLAKDITVLDKAGWVASSTAKYNAVCDNGIITCGDRDYLMCVMTSVPYTESNASQVSALANAVFAAHDQLTEQPAAEQQA